MIEVFAAAMGANERRRRDGGRSRRRPPEPGGLWSSALIDFLTSAGAAKSEGLSHLGVRVRRSGDLLRCLTCWRLSAKWR